MLLVNAENITKKTEQEICFHCNPLVELVASLHVLSNPDHHEACQSWIMKMNSILDKGLRAEINYFATNYAQWLFIMDIVTRVACEKERSYVEESRDFEYYLRKFEELCDEDFAYAFLSMAAFRLSRETLREWMKDPDAISKEKLQKIERYISPNNVIMFLRNIDSYRKRLLHIFRAYWDRAFGAFWEESLRSFISDAVVKQKVTAGKGSVVDYILSVHELIHVEDGKLLIKKEVDYEMELSEIGYVHVFPSLFTGPHLMLDIWGNELILYYNLDFYELDRSAPVPADMLECLKVLGDESRLKVLKLIWEEGLTTQRLAQILNLAPSTVSVHLKLLKKADLVSCRQVKKFVYYTANQERIEEICQQLGEYLS